MSQNYIRSKKAIGSLGLIVNKGKKKSIPVRYFSKDLSELKEPSENSDYKDMIIDDTSDHFKSRIFFTKKSIGMKKFSRKKFTMTEK